MSATALKIDGLFKSFPPTTRGVSRSTVLDSIKLHAEFGEVVGLFGPSGCGKSTLLKIVAGLERSDSGLVQVYDNTGNPWSGAVAYVPQGHDLFPWKTLLENTLIGTRIVRRRAPDDATRAAVQKLVQRFGMADAARRYPFQSSGGERQRAAIIRALVTPSPLLVLDEPLAAVDYLTRAAISENLLSLIDERSTAGSPLTSLIVSHDPEELLLLCDRIYVFSPRPATVLEVLRVPFQRPRLADLRFDAAFVSLKRRLWSSLRPGEARPK